MENFESSHRIGIVDFYGRGKSVYITVRFKDGELSITGAIGPNRHGNAASCGQIENDVKHLTSYAKGWDWKMIGNLKKIWKEWHLNHMNAGSPNQTKWLKENPQIRSYDEIRDHMPKDIFEDGEYFHNGKPYRYGSAWLKREVPQDVLEWLKALPETDRPHPWHG